MQMSVDQTGIFTFTYRRSLDVVSAINNFLFFYLQSNNFKISEDEKLKKSPPIRQLFDEFQ